MDYLPFQKRFWPKLLSGEKTKTCRNSAYGKPGDIVNSPVGPIRILAVEKVRLADVAELHWQDEGVSGPNEFMRIWVELHPMAGWTPDAKKFLHTIKVVR